MVKQFTHSLVTRAFLVMAAVAGPSIASAQLVQYTDGTAGGAAFFTLLSPGSSASGCTAPAGASPSCGSTGNLTASSSVIPTTGLSAETFRLLTSFSSDHSTAYAIKFITLQLYSSSGARIFTSEQANQIFSGPAGGGPYLGFLGGTADFTNFNTALASATTLGLTVITTNDIRGGTTSFSLASTAAPTVNATPEPASLVLLGTGLLGVFGVSHRRKSQRA
jgi:hypothetical protein